MFSQRNKNSHTRADNHVTRPYAQMHTAKKNHTNYARIVRSCFSMGIKYETAKQTNQTESSIPYRCCARYTRSQQQQKRFKEHTNTLHFPMDIKRNKRKKEIDTICRTQNTIKRFCCGRVQMHEAKKRLTTKHK